MKAITYYEVYVVKHGHWALHARLSQGEQNQALEVARALQAETERATQVLEESLHPEEERLIVRVIGQYGQAPMDTQPPSTEVGMASRIFMVVVNAVGIGAIATMGMAIAVSTMRDSGAPGNAYNMLLLFTFAAAVLTAGLTLFKIYVPMEWILWQSKGIEAQKRAIEALLYGTPDPTPSWAALRETDSAAPKSIDDDETLELPSEMAVMDAPPAPPAPTLEAPAVEDGPQRFETMADQGEQTSFQITETTATAAAAPAESLIDSATAVMDSLLEKDRGQLIAFTDAAMSALSATKPQLQAFERVGLNLYLAGAARAIAERGGFSDAIKTELLSKALVHSGTHVAVAEAFGQRLDAASNRPRFRNLIDAGHAAMQAVIDENPNAALPPCPI